MNSWIHAWMTGRGGRGSLVKREKSSSVYFVAHDNNRKIAGCDFIFLSLKKIITS